MKNINQKTLQTAKQLGYIPICALDQKRPYVLKAKKYNNFYIIKTNHFDDEAKILKILNQTQIDNVIIPKLYEFSNKYIVEDYLTGKVPTINDVCKNMKLIRVSIDSFQKALNKINALGAYTKDSQDKNTKLYEASGAWLGARLKYWFADQGSEKKYRFNNESIKKSIEYFNKFNTKTIINFGAFSRQHFRIYKGKIGIFDFGRHIRYAPTEYDWAYLWWGYFLHEAGKHTLDFWIDLMETMAKYADNKTEFYACIIERLAGIAKDLTHRNDVDNNIKKINRIKELRDLILNFVLENK